MKLFSSDYCGRLQATADAAIWLSHRDTYHWLYRRTTSNPPPEEDYVASLIVRALPQIDSAWQPLFRQWNLTLRLTGVFCHQTPKARYQYLKKTVSPELADLLIVRRRETRTHQVRQVATLVQAKMSETGEIRLGSNDPQLHLLEQWPALNIIGPNAPKDLLCIGRFDGQAMYAGIQKGWSPCPDTNKAWAAFCPWGMMRPKHHGWVDDPFSLYLVRMLNFEVGREFFDPNATGCHWSLLIDYLLKTTFSMPLRTRDIRRDPDFVRGKTIAINRLGFTSSAARTSSAYVPAARVSNLSGNGDSIPPDDDSREFDEGGMGRVVIIETSEVEG